MSSESVLLAALGGGVAAPAMSMWQTLQAESRMGAKIAKLRFEVLQMAKRLRALEARDEMRQPYR